MVTPSLRSPPDPPGHPHRISPGHLPGQAGVNEGVPTFHYNAMTVSRYTVKADEPLPAGRVKLELEFRYDSKEREAPATVTFRANGKEIGSGRVGRSVPAGFTASESFDIGVDLGSPVALEYHEKAPFAFEGKIHTIRIEYLDGGQPSLSAVLDD